MKKLGFGLMRLPRPDPDNWKEIDWEATQELLDRYMAEGFSYFDTAYFYHGGNSEKAFGKLVAARYPRESFVLTSKMPVFIIKRAEEYPAIFEKQLQRCQVSYFDYYFLHGIGKAQYPAIEEMDGFGFLRRMKAEGKIRHIGFSYHDDAQTLDRILSDHPETELVQLQLNYIDWEDEGIQGRKCYEVCCAHGVDVAVMEPLKGGALAKLPEEAAAILKAVAPEASLASWGIRYAASLERVKVVLSGMNTMEQLEDNMGYMKAFQPLSGEERAALEKTVELIRRSIAVPCTACHYCTDGCPKRIAIPEYFALYNNQAQFGKLPGVTSAFKNLLQAHGKPSECIGCGQCEAHCPQHLPIMEHLKEVETVFER